MRSGKSKLDQHKQEVFSLYESGMGAPEIQKTLNLKITPRSIQRYLSKHNKIRSTREALKLSEPRRIKTIQTNWSKHRKVRRKVLAPKRRYTIMERDNFRCQICGATAGDGNRLEVDYEVPIHLGGTNKDNNLQTLCYDCNIGKYHHQEPIYRAVPSKL